MAWRYRDRPECRLAQAACIAPRTLGFRQRRNERIDFVARVIKVRRDPQPPPAMRGRDVPLNQTMIQAARRVRGVRTADDARGFSRAPRTDDEVAFYGQLRGQIVA